MSVLHGTSVDKKSDHFGGNPAKFLALLGIKFVGY